MLCPGGCEPRTALWKTVSEGSQAHITCDCVWDKEKIGKQETQLQEAGGGSTVAPRQVSSQSIYALWLYRSCYQAYCDKC